MVILLSIGEHSRDVSRYSPWGEDRLLSAPDGGPLHLHMGSWAWRMLCGAVALSAPSELRQEGTLLRI